MRRSPVPRRFDVALALRRRPRHRQALVAGLALLCGVTVMGVVQRAEGARAAWGEGVPVLVATRDLGPGDRLDGGNTRIDRRPAPVVAEGALDRLPADGRLTAAVFAGEAVLRARLAPGGLSPIAARVPTGTRAMAVPTDAGTVPALAVGDRVDVLVALPAEAAGAGPPGFALTTDVLVVDVTEVAVTIAVPVATAPRLAVAFGTGAVSLALAGA